MDEYEQLKTVWDYMKMNHVITHADAIIAFGSYDPKVGEYAAKLFLDGYAPILIFSGGQSDSTKMWSKSEAETFYDIAIAMGVPKEKIFIETTSTNSGENITYTKELIKKNNLKLDTAVVVQKTFMERRVYAALSKQWPELDIIVTSHSETDLEYYIDLLGYDSAVGDILGDLERIKKYPELGFQIEQNIPDDVWNARCILRGLGYCKKEIQL